MSKQSRNVRISNICVATLTLLEILIKNDNLIILLFIILKVLNKNTHTHYISILYRDWIAETWNREATCLKLYWIIGNKILN